MSKHPAPMRHTMRFGLVCAVLSGVLLPLVAGIGIGYGIGESHPHQHCAVTK